MTPTDRDALARALDIAHKDRAEAKRIDNRIASGDDWFDLAHVRRVSLPDNRA